MTVRHETWFVAALALLWLAATAWVRPLMLPDEGRYAAVAWEMLRSGDWLTPTLNGLPFFHKPPLFYWITAAAMSLFGVNGWAARAAPMFGAWLGAFALYLFVRRWVSARTARLSLIVLLTQPLFYLGGQYANLDMLVAGCISATILLLAHAALSHERALPYRGALAGGYAMAAVGMLAKGLIGFVLPGLVLVAWLLLRRQWRTLLALIWWPGVIVFMLVAAPWFIAMQSRFPAFLDYFFIVQHFKRFAEGGFNNPMPFWFYPAVLLLFSLPWLPWLHRLFRRDYLGDSERGPVRLLMALWLIAITGFFSLPQSKLLGYILPAVPPLAFLTADAFRSIASPSATARRMWWAGALLGVLFSFGAVAAYALKAKDSSRELAGVLAVQRGERDAVFMLHQYAYDLPFYARLREPVTVVDDWASPEIKRHDDWRKELVDAGQFAPVLAASVLIAPAALPAALCRNRVNWLIGPSGVGYPFLALAEKVSSQREVTLWKIEPARPGLANALGCAGTPNADSANK
jgi:4-amino-4-deoxy-L-arabinose transferase-like glycosyltransferase